MAGEKSFTEKMFDKNAQGSGPMDKIRCPDPGVPPLQLPPCCAVANFISRYSIIKS